MSMFKEAENQMAYLKAGFMGFQGSGKTTTATKLAVGLQKLLTERGLPGGGAPIFFADTETGADWVKRDCDEAGVNLLVNKTRAFKHLVPMVDEVEKTKSILIIDSITHFWRDLTESYARKKNRKHGLQFQDWSFLKEEWGKFTDAYVNSNAHIIMCGRAGYEYSNEKNEETGKNDLIKDGVKMKAEGETGYEPNLLVFMERLQGLNKNSPEVDVKRQALILKDRSRLLDGKSFLNPCFEDFLPHIECLNLGGTHVGVDTDENSDSIIPGYDNENTALERKICMEEIKEEINKHLPGTTAAVKKQKGDLWDSCMGHRSQTRFESSSYEELLNVREKVWQRLNGHSYDQRREDIKEDLKEQSELTF